MDYEAFFQWKIDGLRREGNYRVFAELERHAGVRPRKPACIAPNRSAETTARPRRAM